MNENCAAFREQIERSSANEEKVKGSAEEGPGDD